MYKEDKILIILLTISLAFGLPYIYLNMNIQSIFITSFLILISFIPYSTIKYLEVKRMMEIEGRFPDFIRDLSESVKSGMVLPIAIKMLSKTNYGALSSEVKRLSIRLEWIPVKDAMVEFKNRLSRSKLISRSIDIFLEAYISGGNISSTLNSIAKTTVELREVEEDRRTMMSEQAVMIIVISIVFIGITVSLFKLIVPILVARSGEYMNLFQFGNVSIDYYRSLFMTALFVQSIVGGMLAGYVSDNNFVIGLKNAVILIAISAIAFGLIILPKTITFDVNVVNPQVSYMGNIEIIGSFYVDENPAKNAQIIINDHKFFADDKGQFDIYIKAKHRGNYTLNIIGEYNNIKTEKELSVKVV